MCDIKLRPSFVIILSIEVWVYTQMLCHLCSVDMPNKSIFVDNWLVTSHKTLVRLVAVYMV